MDENRKMWLFAGWVVAVGVAATALGLTSVTHWVVAAVVAAVPPTVIRRLWRVPERTLSESINDARG
jgi:hypothetical protein